MASEARRLRLCVRRQAATAGTARIALRVPSDVTVVEEAVEVLTRHCLVGDPAGSRLRFRLQTALAEALANAVLRGNGADADKSVQVVADVTVDEIRVHVGDEGDGFDPAAVGGTPPDPDAEHGRGILMLRSLVDALQYNARGNALWMTLRRH